MGVRRRLITFRESILIYITALQQKKNNEVLSNDRKFFVMIFVYLFGIASLIIGALIIYRALPLHLG